MKKLIIILMVFHALLFAQDQKSKSGFQSPNNAIIAKYFLYDGSGMNSGGVGLSWEPLPYGYFSNISATNLTTTNLTVTGATTIFGDTTYTGNVSGSTYTQGGTVTDAEFTFINSLTGNAQTQLDLKMLKTAFGDSLAAYDGDGLKVTNNDNVDILVDYNGSIEITDDSLNVKLNGSTLTSGVSGLSVTNDPADRLLKIDFGDSLVTYEGWGLDVLDNNNIHVDSAQVASIYADGLKLLKTCFGDSLTAYDGYGVTITDNQDIKVDTSAIATVYDIGLKLNSADSTGSVGYATQYDNGLKLNSIDSTGSTGYATQYDIGLKCDESVFGTSIGTGLTLDGTTLKTHAALQSIAGLTEADVSILEATADNVYSVVTSGGNNYILGSNSGNTALEFKTPTGSGAPVLATSPTFTQTVTTGTATDQLVPSDILTGDADSDGSATTSESWTRTLTANATPTSAYWLNSLTQGSGWAFNGAMTIGGAVSPGYGGSSKLFVINVTSANNQVGIYGNTGLYPSGHQPTYTGYGVRFTAEKNTNNNWGTLVGAEMYSTVYGTGTVTTATGFRTKPVGFLEDVASIVTAANGLKVQAPTRVGTNATVGTVNGISIENMANSWITTSYGLYLAAQSGSATNYAIYSEGGNSYHVGAFGFGGQSPDSAVVQIKTGIKTHDIMLGNTTPRSWATAGGGWVSVCSEKFKENFKDLIVDLSKFKNLNPKEYNFKLDSCLQKFNSKECIGWDTLSIFAQNATKLSWEYYERVRASKVSTRKHKFIIAEDLNTITGRNDNYIDRDELISVMILKIKELENRIEKLEGKK